MNKIPMLLAGSLLCLLLISCEKDDFQSTETLDSYFQLFEHEAALRGVIIDISAQNIIGSIEEISIRHVAGQCTHSSHAPNKVKMDKTFWRKASPTNREYAVFHELGHCILDRDHTNTRDAEGYCLSIMASSNIVCQSAYTAERREAYLDELFEHLK